MRSVQVNVSPEVCETIVDLAHRSRIAVVNVINTDAIHRDGMREERVAISFEASTPDAKKFVDTLLASEIFDPERVWVDVRERRAIVNHETLSRITYPWVMPPTDIVEDLYQFSHVTVGLIGRVFVAACLLAYGLAEQNVLLMIAGMMFIPLLPVLSAVGFGAWVGHRRLWASAAAVIVLTCALLFAGGLAVGAILSQPVKYDDFPSLLAGALISIAVGVAAALANTDDVGRRELIGLAATSQIAIIPAWCGLVVTRGEPLGEDAHSIAIHLASLVINVLSVIIASLATYVAIGAADKSLSKLKQ